MRNLGRCIATLARQRYGHLLGIKGVSPYADLVFGSHKVEEIDYALPPAAGQSFPSPTVLRSLTTATRNASRANEV